MLLWRVDQRIGLSRAVASVMHDARRARLVFASHHPYRDTFLTAAQALAP